MKKRSLYVLCAVVLALAGPVAAWLLLPGRARPTRGAPLVEGDFYDSGQALGNANSHGVAVADLNGDAHPDAFVANDHFNVVWVNDGSGSFTSGQSLDDTTSADVALGDLDGDTDLDAFVANRSGDPSRIWWNNGNGQFTGGPSFPGSETWGVAVGDLDGDTDLDIFTAHGSASGEPNRVWINQGVATGVFTDSGQTLGSEWSYAVALGDLDGDTDLDAFTATWFPPGGKVWINNGAGIFSDSGQALGSSAAIGVALGDVDGDSDLDAVVATNFPDGSQIWLNDGSGAFSASGQAIDPNVTSNDVALEDLDGDTDLDLFVANFGPNSVWRNGDPGLVATFDVERTTNPQGDEVTYWGSDGTATLPIALNQAITHTVETHTRIRTPSDVMTQTIPFDPGEQVKFLQLVNPMPDPSETVTLTLHLTEPGIPPGPADVTDRLLLVFVDSDQGLDECILCYLEWLARFLGFDPAFGTLHHLSLPNQEASPLWDYYTALFDYYAPEMASVTASNPGLLWQSLDALEDWTPAAESVAAGTGDTTLVSQELVDDTVSFFDGLEAEASPGLKAAIQHERAALDLPSLVGMNLNAAFEEIEARRQVSFSFVTIILNGAEQ